MSIHYFEYDGKRSDSLVVSDFDTLELTFGYFNSYEPSINMSRNIIKGSMNRFRSTPNHMGTSWGDVLTFDIGLIKSPCYHGSEDMYFTEDEMDYIDTWLTSPEYPTLLRIYDVDVDAYLEDVELYSNELFLKYNYFGLFSNIQPTYSNGQIVGLSATFTTNSPFAWTDEYTQTATCPAGETTAFSFAVNHAERNREIFPVITIQVNDETASTAKVDITLTNQIDGNSIKMSIDKNELITIDSKYTRIFGASGEMTFEDVDITDVGYIYWPRLYHGTNTFNIEVSSDNTVENVEVTIKYREARKVGAY